MRHEPHIRGLRVSAPAAFKVQTSTPLTLATRIAHEAPTLERMGDLVSVGRQRTGLYALPAPEAALVAYILGWDTSGGSITTKMVEVLVPKDWLAFADRHPQVGQAHLPSTQQHDFLREGPDDGATMVLSSDPPNQQNRQAWVHFPDPKIHITFPDEHDDKCFVRNWLIAGCLAKHFGINTDRVEHFVEDSRKGHFVVPAITADTFFRVGAWLGLSPQNQDTTTDAGAPR